jgi:hypothetical protein
MPEHTERGIPTGLDLQYNDHPICPYCGAEDEGAWEMEGEDGTTDCGECEREYRWSRNVSVTYDTERMEGEGDGE